MTRLPADQTPEPSGGRAAERLREFLSERFPGEVVPPEIPAAPAEDDQRETERQPEGPPASGRSEDGGAPRK